MAQKPIFVITHPRACSTAFERVFMTRRDTLQCVHEPFGDAYYYGSERLGKRYDNDEQARKDSGFSETTYKTVFEGFDREASEGKRVFIKDMAYYLMPADGKPANPAPSLKSISTANGSTTNGSSSSKSAPRANGSAGDVKNPTVVPVDYLEKFHFAFLVRDPHYSIPSYYRCTIPPLDKLTGWSDFDMSEAGYEEMRRFFDYVREIRLVGPRHANDGRVENGKPNGSNGTTNGANGTNGTNGTSSREGVEICMVDADDLLDNPTGIIERFCNSVGVEYTPEMLIWDTEEAQSSAKAAFEKWPGFHEDALSSGSLKARAHKKAPKTEAQFDDEWREKYGEKGAKIIRATVDACMSDYLYLKKFTIKA